MSFHESNKLSIEFGVKLKGALAVKYMFPDLTQILIFDLQSIITYIEI